MCTFYHINNISFPSGRRVIKILSPHLPFSYPEKKIWLYHTFLSGQLLASQLWYGTIWYYVHIIVQTHLTRCGQHHNSAPRTAPPCLHFPSQPPPAASRRWPLPQASLATTCAFFPCRQFQALRLQLQLVSINHHCQQRLLHQTPSPQNEDCCTCSKAC